MLFYFNNSIEKKSGNSFISGFITGIICSPIINTFEVNKVQSQIQTEGEKIKRKFTILRLGLGATLARESIGTSLYFGCYNKMREHKINPFFSGGLAGAISWFTTYPIDVVKTRIQSKEHVKYLDAFKKGNLWSGISVCLLRSFIVNSISFSFYDYIKN